MRVTRKGQVTIPQAIREQAGLAPGTEVVFEIDDAGQVRLRPDRGGAAAEVAAAVERLRGKARRGLSTEEIMALTRE